jgi:hypothetical protein
MKKLRGKQPTKPDVNKALMNRNLDLKGADKASMTIPIIYRKTFSWDQPGVTFVPINHRSFVVFKGDLDTEEYLRDTYSKVVLDINSIPHYVKNRVSKDDYTLIVELKEALLAASLKERYMQITIPKPKDQKLYDCLRTDMEEIVGELGFEYSTDHEGIQLTSKFPKHDIKYYAMESKVCLQNSLSSLEYFRGLIKKDRFEGALAGIEDLLYNTNRLELLMDRYFSDSLNLIWDLPNVSCPGYFLWVNACENIMDEFMYISRETSNTIKSVKAKDIQFIGKDKDIFGFVWDKAVEKSLEFCNSALETMVLEPDDNCIQAAYSVVYNYEQHRKKIGSERSRFVKLFAGEGRYFRDTDRAARLLTASYHLNNIFQSTERIIDYSNLIAKNTLRIGIT